MDEHPSFLKLFLTEDIYLTNADRAQMARGSSAPVEQAAEPPKPQQTTQPAQTETVKKAEEVEPAVAPAPITFHGENAQNILILANYPNEQHISQADADFLGKILTAVKLSYKDVAVVNYHRYQDQAGADGILALGAKKVVNFGINTPMLAKLAEAKPYELAHFSDFDLLLADPLPTIAADKTKKRLLWECLQQLFF